MVSGIKYDNEKARWSLLPLDVMTDVVKVLTLGAKKYADHNWQPVTPKERYFDAAMRHLAAWRSGERADRETGLSPLAHAICCIIFLAWHDKNTKGETPHHDN